MTAMAQIIAMNDDWRDDQEEEIIATGIPPSNDLESAIVGSFTAGILPPGPYTDDRIARFTRISAAHCALP